MGGFAMKQERTFWVVGGDLRQAHLAQLLARDGHTVYAYALEQGAHAAPDARMRSALTGIGEGDCIVLPLPVCSAPGMLSTPLSEQEHPITPILDFLTSGQLICGGRFDKDTLHALSQRGLQAFDYFEREELIVANAVPTAEGAVQIAMEELPITIHNARVLITGYGRVGRASAQRFGALGAQVTVAARSCEQLAWVDACGLQGSHISHLPHILGNFDLVINTIPAPVLDRDALCALRPDALVIDLASKPGGVDMDTATQLGRKVIWALSLPGKVAPITAGACIRDTIYNLLREVRN